MKFTFERIAAYSLVLKIAPEKNGRGNDGLLSKDFNLSPNKGVSQNLQNCRFKTIGDTQKVNTN